MRMPLRHLLAALLSLPGLVGAAVLSINNGNTHLELEKPALLSHSEARDIDVPHDVSYQRPMRYRAVPFAPLLKQAGFKASDTVRIVALDGFAATLPASLLLNENGAEPWLAIEPDDAHWPPVKPGGDGASAGPLYLVWLNPEKSKVTPEQWPYQIARIDRVAAVEERYPALAPAATLAADSPVRAGFAMFQKHCMACHTLNRAGDANLGPDLNVPRNPTEYLREPYLQVLIRNPQSLRSWGKAQMPAFSEETLSETELNQLMRYLKHMATRKVR